MPGTEAMTLAFRLRAAYAGKTVVLTGHTGFKGAWLSEWLLMLGARVVGIALEPPTDPSLFDRLGLAGRMDHHIQDIRDRDGLVRLIAGAEPDYLFHLAAQSLVRESYAQPGQTCDVNIMGTVHVLEALQEVQKALRGQENGTCSAVLVTTDKVYFNREWVHAYREEDTLGGFDAYSASKACAELMIASFRQSFFNPADAATVPRVGIASARAGNVIGGGDWATDRLVPDCVRALRDGREVLVRNPDSTRPWQHVLEPLSGYLTLGMRQREALDTGTRDDRMRLSSAFNFGPDSSSVRSVGELVEEVITHLPGLWARAVSAAAPHEAGQLSLASEKASQLLHWRPVWGFAETVRQTMGGYAAFDASAGELQRNIQTTIQSFVHDSV